ncbi:hypothetical protein [Pseudoruegeria sp. HB172150]|uniref:hypothetical protein n=1 Tax=Pseudoruegeria sp. HB172150 TaxID=2721164 RepID=UPI0015522383|nr:hypothetical protein [Pseudoruegeria sp. HB172150]
MQQTAGVSRVIYDAASRRYEGHVHLRRDGEARVLTVSAPGHPGWPHRRIADALIASAQTQPKAFRHAHP